MIFLSLEFSFAQDMCNPFPPILILELVLLPLLQLLINCFESDFSILDELSEYPSLREFVIDFLLLISYKLLLMRCNNLGSVNNEF